MKIVIISDLHANYYALKEALKIIDKTGYDMMICLGDILSYGADIKQVVNTIGNRIKKKNTLLIKGNHDEIYDDIFAGKESKYIDSLPNWLKESIYFTAERLNQSDWDDLKFIENYSQDGVFYSHANPFADRDWSYLNSSFKLEKASKILKKTNHRVGIFGHLHRVLNSTFSEKNILKINSLRANSLSNKEINILNTGSIGQPRDKNNPRPSFLWLDINIPNDFRLENYQYKYQLEFFDYPINEHLKSIQTSTLSLKTKEKLLSYFLKKN